MKIMLIVVFTFGILAQEESFQISWNNVDTTEGPSLVSTLRVEKEETTSHTSYRSRGEDDDPKLGITSTLHPDIPDFSESIPVSNSLLTEQNAAIFPNHNKSPETSTIEFPEINTPASPVHSTTVFPKVTNSLIPEASNENPLSKCPNVGGPQVAGSVVKCHCQGNEISVNGKCQFYDGAIVIPVERHLLYTEEADVKSYNVTVQDVNCDASKHRYMNFTKNHFHLRPRGDVVLLKEAGELEGQRINNYCISHHLDEHNDLTLTMKACVPIPSVPRCCHFGMAIKERKCEVANTPAVLKPPISAKPFSESINWDSITEYHSPVKCHTEYEHLKTISLDHKISSLVSLANGVANVWIPGDIGRRYSYYNCPEYCVDGITNSAGSVDYFTSFCYSDPMETHKKACANGACLRKCCKYGYSMDKNSYLCVPDPNSTFTPSTDMESSNYNIVIGWPLCSPVYNVKDDVSVDGNGSLILKDKQFNSSDFCVDTFLDNEQRKTSALACTNKNSLWLEVRPYLLSICNVISLIFLMITIVSHLLVPELLANGGLHQLCHMIALSISCITNFFVHVIPDRLALEDCVNTAIAMQFGFLTTFFWLNVMCFEIWRKIRRLKNYRPCKSYPNKYYMIYGWGIPLCICVINILTQKHNPKEIWEFYEVPIAELRCLLRDNFDLSLYFYGPIAVLFLFNSVFLVLTCIDFKIMLRNYKKITNDLKDLGAGVTSKQNTDHVHDFNQKLKIFVLMATCWVISLVMAVMPWKVPPLDLWPYTDILNSLQGIFLFIILMSNSNKRKHLEEKYPRPFQWIKRSSRLPAIMKR